MPAPEGRMMAAPARVPSRRKRRPQPDPVTSTPRGCREAQVRDRDELRPFPHRQTVTALTLRR